jgi:hypothetical protein
VTPAVRKQIAALAERHMAMAAKSIVPIKTAERDADRSYVERAADALVYHVAVADALKAYLEDHP